MKIIFFIGIENPRLSEPKQRLLERRHAERRVHRVRQPPGQNRPADVERLVAENERLKAENARLVAEAAEREAEYLAAVDVGNAGIEQNIKRSEGYLAQAAHLREIAQQERDAQAMHWVEIAKERERLKLPPLGVPDGTLLQ